MNSKLAVKPSEGIYYAVPDPDGGFRIFSQRSDEVEEPLHFEYWEKILPEIARIWKLSLREKDTLRDHYTAVPRGRIVKEHDYDKGVTGNYVVAHGDDVPLNQIKAFVLQDFGLLGLNREGKIKWKVDPHEKMDSEDKDVFKRIISGKA